MKWLILLCLILPCFSMAKVPKELGDYLKSRWDLSQTEQQYLSEGKVLTNADVSSESEKQYFDMQATAWHSKKCRKVIRKLNQFELYPEWISFVKKLTYDDETNLMTMLADHPLLPFPMIVHIIVKRPKKVGKYQFKFPTGMFKGLTGYFDIKEINKRCFLYAESTWKGKKTKIPNLAIEIFSETLARIGGEILMRKSK